MRDTDKNDVDIVLLTPEEAAKSLRTKPATLALWRVRGGGPDFVKVGHRVAYTPEAIARFVADNTHRSTSTGGRANAA